jgi:hypothetical protein
MRKLDGRKGGLLLLYIWLRVGLLLLYLWLRRSLHPVQAAIGLVQEKGPLGSTFLFRYPLLFPPCHS